MNEGNHHLEHGSKHEDKPRSSKKLRMKKSFEDDFLTYLLKKELWTYEETMTSSVIACY